MKNYLSYTHTVEIPQIFQRIKNVQNVTCLYESQLTLFISHNNTKVENSLALL